MEEAWSKEKIARAIRGLEEGREIGGFELLPREDLPEDLPKISKVNIAAHDEGMPIIIRKSGDKYQVEKIPKARIRKALGEV